LIKKIIKISQKTDWVKLCIIGTYLFLVIPVGISSMSLTHSSAVYYFVVQALKITGLLAFWFCSILLGRLSGVTHGYAGYLVIIGLLANDEFDFLLGHQILFIVLFVLGTLWLIYDLLRAFLYPSTIARIDASTITYNIIGSFVSFVIGYCMAVTPSITLAYLTDNFKNNPLFVNSFYYFLHFLGAVAVILSILFYLRNSKLRANYATIWGNSFLIIASFSYVLLLYAFINLIWTPFFYYVVVIMILGSVLLIPLNINKNSLKNHDLAV
jgi:hypothetical protein